jgi:hypothetical protein
MDEDAWGQDRGSVMKTPGGFCGFLSQRPLWITGGIDFRRLGEMTSREYV